MTDLIKKLTEREKKIQTNLTLDESIWKRLQEFKKKNKIPTLSPMVNEMLREWLDKNGGES